MTNILETIERVKREQQEGALTKERRKREEEQRWEEYSSSLRAKFKELVKESGIRDDMEVLATELSEKERCHTDIFLTDPIEDPPSPKPIGVLYLIWGNQRIKTTSLGFSHIRMDQGILPNYKYICAVFDLNSEQISIWGTEGFSIPRKNWSSSNKQLLQDALAKAYLNPKHELVTKEMLHEATQYVDPGFP